MTFSQQVQDAVDPRDRCNLVNSEARLLARTAKVNGYTLSQQAVEDASNYPPGSDERSVIWDALTVAQGQVANAEVGLA